MKITFIGLGIMGSRMATNLQKAGYKLTIYNRSKEKASDLIEKGANWANSPIEAVKDCDIIITMLANPKAVKENALGEHGFLKNLNKNSIWIDSSTVDPGFSKEMANIASRHGVLFLDAPVAGTKQPAESGELVFLVGGDHKIFKKCSPLLDVMGKKTIHLGENGNGSAMKLLINQLLAQSMVAFSEAMVLGEAMGLSQETLFNVLLNVPVTPPYLAAIRPKFENGDYDTNFPLKWMQKDLHLATTTAYENNVTMPSLNAVKEVFAMAKQKGYADLDFSSVYEFLKTQAE